jgi:hypothetical protein
MSGSGKMQYDTNDGKKKEDEPMIDPHNLDYFLEQDTNPSLFQEKEDLENCFHHPQSFEIGTSSSLHTYIHTYMYTYNDRVCNDPHGRPPTSTRDHHHRR